MSSLLDRAHGQLPTSSRQGLGCCYPVCLFGSSDPNGWRLPPFPNFKRWLGELLDSGRSGIKKSGTENIYGTLTAVEGCFAASAIRNRIALFISRNPVLYAISR